MDQTQSNALRKARQEDEMFKVDSLDSLNLKTVEGGGGGGDGLLPGNPQFRFESLSLRDHRGGHGEVDDDDDDILQDTSGFGSLDFLDGCDDDTNNDLLRGLSSFGSLINTPSSPSAATAQAAASATSATSAAATTMPSSNINKNQATVVVEEGKEEEQDPFEALAAAIEEDKPQ